MNELTLKQEVALLRSAVAGLIGRDREGEYRPELVTAVLAALDRKPTHTFTSVDAFLEEVKKA